MKDVIILVNKAEQTNVFADHLRIAEKALGKEGKVVVWQGSPPSLKGKIVLKVGNTFFLGSEQFGALEKRLGEAAMVFTITNDYTSAPPTQVRRALRELVAKGRKVVTLTTVPRLDSLTRWRGVWYTNSEYVDWNRASYLRTKYPPAFKPREGLIYWGALRPDRIPSFDRYFKTKEYAVNLSGAHRSREKWQARYPHAQWHGRLSIDECAKWQGTIYMEDECQHGEYHSVASRFYEAIGRGLLVLVDVKTWGTFKTAGIDVYDYLVEAPHDVGLRLRDGKLRAKQQKSLVRDYTDDVVRQLRAAMRKHL